MATEYKATKSLKRKAEEAKRSSKKSRTAFEPESRSDGGSPASDVEAQILSLETSILKSKKNYNNIVILLAHAQQASAPQAAILAAVSLTRVFIRFLAVGSLIPNPTLLEKDTLVVYWLKDRLSDLKACLTQLIAGCGGGNDDEVEEEGAVIAVTLAMRLVKTEGIHLYDHGEYIFPRVFIEDILRAVLEARNESVREVFLSEYLDKFIDVRFFGIQALHNILKIRHVSIDSQQLLFDNTFYLLSSLTPVSPSTKDDFLIPKPKKKTHALNSDSQRKKQVQDAWLTLMSLGLTGDQRKRILEITVQSITPWFSQPELLADFLTDSYNAGGATSLLALGGVYYLITERNLDYPSLYPKLYSLLDTDILHSRYRARFFRLLDLCLSSTHLPAALVASFIKRLARLSLFATPSAIVFVVPLLYNLFQRHRQTTFMMHREMLMKVPQILEEIEFKGFNDHFDMNERDPLETRAIDSCIWEIVQLQHHYHPNVASIAKIVSEQFTRPMYNIEDFLDHSYGTLLEAETAKQVKKPPVVEFHIPKKIFLPNETGTEDDRPLARLWDFS